MSDDDRKEDDGPLEDDGPRTADDSADTPPRTAVPEGGFEPPPAPFQETAPLQDPAGEETQSDAHLNQTTSPLPLGEGQGEGRMDQDADSVSSADPDSAQNSASQAALQAPNPVPEEPDEDDAVPFGGEPENLRAASATDPDDALAEAKALTKQGAKDLGTLLVKHVKEHIPERQPAPPSAIPEPPKLKGRMGQILPVLRVIPWLLGALFLFSFVWDFPDATIGLFGNEVALQGLLKTLAVSGLIGFLTNWLAITMLFQPREKRPIIPQGLIPAQRERVIFRLAQAISQELINEDIIKAKIQESGVITKYRETALDVVHGVIEDEAFRADLKEFVEHYARDLLGSDETRKRIAEVAVEKLEQQAGQGFGGVALRLYRSFREDDFQQRIDQAVAEIPSALGPVLDRIDALLDTVPERLTARADDMESLATRTVLGFVERMDIYAMIVDNAEKYDEQQLERILKTTSNEQLNYIKYLGGILGVFGGFVIWQPVFALAVFVTLGLTLWGLDEALYRARRNEPAS